MKIKKYKEILENNSENSSNKFYIYAVHYSDRTYRGSIWDEPRKPWIPDNAEFKGEFELKGWQSYMVVNQKELDEINQIKEERQRERDAKKYNL